MSDSSEDRCKLSCRLEVLSGDRVIEKLVNAAAFGFDAVSLPGRFLNDYLDELRRCLADTGQRRLIMGDMSIKKIGGYLDKLGWHYQMSEKQGMILSGATGKNGTYMLIIGLQQNDTLLLMLPLAKALEGPNLTKSQLAQLNEMLMDTNFGLAVGGFERNRESGEVRYRVGVPTEDGGLTEAQFRHLLMASCGSVDQNYPKIMQLIHGGITV